MDDNVFTHSQETILTPRTIAFVVKSMIMRGNLTKNIDNFDIDLQHFDITLLSMFIDMSSLSFRKDAPSLMRGLKAQHAHGLFVPLKHVLSQLTSEPFTLIVLVHLTFDCLFTMSVTRHAFNELCNLYYDKIAIQIISFLPTTFNGDILFEMPLLSPSNPSSSQMQGMDIRYDGHTRSKVITTNIKNSFGFNFKKVHYLGHLHCV